MAGITTHVLNTVTGAPGVGMRIDFSVREGDRWRLVKSVRTNADGRTDEMMLKPDDTKVGDYELLFHVDEFFRAQGTLPQGPSFIEQVPVRHVGEARRQPQAVVRKGTEGPEDQGIGERRRVHDELGQQQRIELVVVEQLFRQLLGRRWKLRRRGKLGQLVAGPRER